MPRGTWGVELRLRPLGEVRREVTLGVQKGLAEALPKVVADAKALCPVDPKSRHVAGKTKFRPPMHTRDSIRSFNRIMDGRNVAGLLTTSGRGAWIELGTRAHKLPNGGTVQAPAQPFLRPALDMNRGTILGALEGILR